MKRALAIPTVETVILLLAWTLGGCGKGSDSSTNPTSAQDPIITVTNAWTEENYSNHRLMLSSSDDGKKAGHFTGDETSDVGSFNLTGSWASGKIDFTVNRSQPVSYSADFSSDNPTRLVFHSGSESLILVRNASE